MTNHPGNKNTLDIEQEIPVSESDLESGNDEPYQLEIAAMQDDEAINLDDAIDDDNENPVSHTLIDAAENSGPEEIRDTQELEGEEQESKDRTGSLSPLYKET
ncbi:MAG TPA: hypothetical protein PLS60_04030 [Arenimonas sp.]|nr:hypothetical protein [Arenimonas sp.]